MNSVAQSHSQAAFGLSLQGNTVLLNDGRSYDRGLGDGSASKVRGRPTTARARAAAAG
eukprot:COSAG01_NODE_48292_length_382_cov_2.212014_2_plen_57_part_01